MSTLTFIRDHAIPYMTPQEIVAEAAQLGRIKIERGHSDSTYTAEIQFRNRNNSLVWATGQDTDFFGALTKAIEEAKRLA